MKTEISVGRVMHTRYKYEITTTLPIYETRLAVDDQECLSIVRALAARAEEAGYGTKLTRKRKGRA